MNQWVIRALTELATKASKPTYPKQNQIYIPKINYRHIAYYDSGAGRGGDRVPRSRFHEGSSTNEFSRCVLCIFNGLISLKLDKILVEFFFLVRLNFVCVSNSDKCNPLIKIRLKSTPTNQNFKSYLHENK